MKVIRKEHNGYVEFVEAKKQGVNIKQIFGRYQYIYESKKGMISLVKLLRYDFTNEKDIWEIYELSHNRLFSDVERFFTKRDAERRIRRLLK